MNSYDIKRLALILAVQAEIEGMKAENEMRHSMGDTPTCLKGAFIVKSEELSTLAHSHDEQL